MLLCLSVVSSGIFLRSPERSPSRDIQSALEVTRCLAGSSGRTVPSEYIEKPVLRQCAFLQVPRSATDLDLVEAT